MILGSKSDTYLYILSIEAKGYIESNVLDGCGNHINECMGGCSCLMDEISIFSCELWK
jgi:hypothetical protein